MRHRYNQLKQLMLWVSISLLASICMNILLLVQLSNKPDAIDLQDQRDAGFSDGYDEGWDDHGHWIDHVIIEWCYTGELTGEACEPYESQPDLVEHVIGK